MSGPTDESWGKSLFSCWLPSYLQLRASCMYDVNVLSWLTPDVCHQSTSKTNGLLLRLIEGCISHLPRQHSSPFSCGCAEIARYHCWQNNCSRAFGAVWGRRCRVGACTRMHSAVHTRFGVFVRSNAHSAKPSTHWAGTCVRKRARIVQACAVSHIFHLHKQQRHRAVISQPACMPTTHACMLVAV